MVRGAKPHYAGYHARCRPCRGTGKVVADDRGTPPEKLPPGAVVYTFPCPVCKGSGRVPAYLVRNES